MTAISRNTKYKKAAARIPVISEQDMSAVGYSMRPTDVAALRHLTAQRHDRHIIRIKGNAGVGKSAFAKYLSQAIANQQTGNDALAGCAYVQIDIHAWTTNEDLFTAVDASRMPELIALAIAGKLDDVLGDINVHRPGVFAQVALQSWHRPVVFLIDELDKSQTRTENLFLSFLEDGRVQDTDHKGDGDVLMADLSNVIIIATDNGTRDFSDPMERRLLLDYEMPALAEEAEIKLIRRLTGAPVSVIAATVKAANIIRKKGVAFPSMQEMAEMLISCEVCKDMFEVGFMVKGVLSKRDGAMGEDEIVTLTKNIWDGYGVEKAAAQQAAAQVGV